MKGKVEKLKKRLQSVPRGKISVKWKLFMYLAIFIGVILAILWLFQVVFLEDFYKLIKINQIKSASETIANNIDNEDLQTLVTRIAQSNEVCIIITDNQGNQVCTADVLPDCIIHKMPDRQWEGFYEKAIQNGGTYLERFNRSVFRNNRYDNRMFEGVVPPRDDGMMESMVYTRLTASQDGTQYVVLLNSTISPVSATVSAIRVQILLITAVLLVLALILAIIISRRISAPIVKINQAAKVLATGKYDVHFESSGYREIAELADTLNYAAVELSKVEGLRRELIANISHDLRTPLTMITGYAEVMRDLPGENTPENVQIIIDEAKRLTSLVNDVLDLSKLQSGSQKMNFERLDLTATIQQTMGRYQKLTQQDGYQIRFFHEGNAVVAADELRISQVIYNLINNAITYTGPDKTVTVTQTIKDGWVTVEVTDTGEGIEPDKLPLIWDRYYKVDKEHKRAQMGAGLGLSIVRSVLEMHHARYGVQSTVGKGSTFWFSLPLVGEAKRLPGQEELPESEKNPDESEQSS